MSNHDGVPETGERSFPRVEGCIRLGRKMTAVLERYAAPASQELQLAAEISVLADELLGFEGEDLERRGAALVAAVTALWAYRSDFPEAARPFPMFEPALQAVQYLDSDPSKLRGRGTDDEASTYMAGRIDAALAFLVDASLFKAVRLALDTSGEWICLARAAGFGDGFELAAIDRFSMLAASDTPVLEDASDGDVARATDKLQAMTELLSFLEPFRVA
jgi:hypothetical protein